MYILYEGNLTKISIPFDYHSGVHVTTHETHIQQYIYFNSGS